MNELKTVQAHIDYLRGLIRQISDDSVFSDKYLYKTLSDARSKILKQRVNSGYKPTAWSYNTICVPFEKAEFHDCDCIETGCKVMKSVIEIPEPVAIKDRALITLTDLSGANVIGNRSSRRVKASKYSPISKGKVFWDIVNRKIVVFNDLETEIYLVKAIFAEPYDLNDIPKYNLFGECEDDSVKCFNPDTDYFPIDQGLNSDMYAIALEMLNVSFKAIEDRSNDGQSNLNPDTQ